MITIYILQKTLFHWLQPYIYRYYNHNNFSLFFQIVPNDVTQCITFVTAQQRHTNTFDRFRSSSLSFAWICMTVPDVCCLHLLFRSLFYFYALLRSFKSLFECHKFVMWHWLHMCSETDPLCVCATVLILISLSYIHRIMY